MPALFYGTKLFVLLDLFGDFNMCVFITILHVFTQQNLVFSFVAAQICQSVIIQMQNSRQRRVQILEHLTCNFNRTHVPMYLSLC